MSARLFAVAVLLVVPLALHASSGEEAGEPGADARVTEPNPQAVVTAILRSDLATAQKAAALAKYVRIGDDPMVVAGRFGCAPDSTLHWIKPNSSGAINFTSGLVIQFSNGKVDLIWAKIPGRNDETIADRR